MGLAYVSNERKISAFAAVALQQASPSPGGRATSSAGSAGSSLMDAGAQAPPKTGVYPLVEDLSPKREKPAMTPDQRLTLQKELIVARDIARRFTVKPNGALRALNP